MLPSTTDDSLLDNLSYKEMFRYSRTCKAAHQTVSSYMLRKHKLENVLGKYFTTDQILHFRYLQAMTGMIISGSTALQFFERVLYPESDLDLYVEHRYMRPIALWLASIGYIYTPTLTSKQHDINHDNDPITVSPTFPTLEAALDAKHPKGPVYPIGYGQYPEIFFTAVHMGYLGAVSILNFEKGNKFHEHRKIQIITSPCSPIEMILNFHSTCVMNFITHDKAYSLYPRATFEERRSLMYRSGSGSRQKAHAKYAERGWTMLDGITGDDFHNLNSSLARGLRYVGDRRTWAISIFPKVDAPCPPIAEINSWSLTYDMALKPLFYFSSLISPQLRYCYVVLDDFFREEIQKIPFLLKDTCEEGEETHDALLKSLDIYPNERFR